MEKVQEVNKVFLITVVTAVVVSLFLGAVPAVQKNSLLNLLVSQIVYAVPMLIYIAKNRGNMLESLRIRPLRPITVFLLVIFSYLITPTLNVLNAISMLFSTNVISDSLSDIIKEYPLWVGIVSIGLLPCILEECVYRGVFFHEYQKHSPRTGVLLSGLLFGLMHMNFNQFIYAFVMGIIFALLVEASDSLLGSVIVHFCINTTSVVLSRMAPAAITANGRADLLSYIRILFLPAVVMTVLAFWLLFIITGLERRRGAVAELLKRDNKKRETVVTLPLLLGIGICTALMVYVEIINRFIP